jgi:hypothetical protein
MSRAMRATSSALPQLLRFISEIAAAPLIFESRIKPAVRLFDSLLF